MGTNSYNYRGWGQKWKLSPCLKLQLQQSCLERKVCARVYHSQDMQDHQKYLGYDASETKVFCTIIQKQQQVKSSAVCALVKYLNKMGLTDELGQDIKKFGNKMDKMTRWISGTGLNPINLYTLVATAFID